MAVFVIYLITLPGFQLLAGSVSPSHAYIHVVEFNLDVTVMGMKVKHNDLIHADQHGAVVIPIEVAGEVKAAAEKLRHRRQL